MIEWSIEVRYLLVAVLGSGPCELWYGLPKGPPVAMRDARKRQQAQLPIGIALSRLLTQWITAPSYEQLTVKPSFSDNHA